MRKVNIHDAKTNLSRLVDEAAQGEAFIIAKAGRPLVKVVPLDAGEHPVRRRIGFLAGQIKAPGDIKTPFQDEITAMFHGDE